MSEVSVSISLTRKEQGALYMAHLATKKKLAAMTSARDELLKSMTILTAVAHECEHIASNYSGCIDGIEEHGGDDHEDPSCAIYHRLYYAMFDARAALAKAAESGAKTTPPIPVAVNTEE